MFVFTQSNQTGMELRLDLDLQLDQIMNNGEIQNPRHIYMSLSTAMGDGFIARDITFVNNAGPAKHQAVALCVGFDKSAIFHCSIVGYQDTLYTHSKR
jgi:pectin methylesterase-like acyl-CoA thioesterase